MTDLRFITVQEWIEDVTNYYKTKYVFNISHIFNASSYYDLASGYMVRRYIDLAEYGRLGHPKTISLLSLTSVISGNYFWQYEFFKDNKMKDIINITWVNTNRELPKELIQDDMIYLSFEMAYDYLDKWWNDIYSSTGELIELQKFCLENTDIEEFLYSEKIHPRNSNERFFTVEVYETMKYLKQ